MGSPFHGEAAISPQIGYARHGCGCKSDISGWVVLREDAGVLVQLRGAEMGGGPRPIGFFGLSVPT
jgi:hypothetical protein